MRCEDCHGLGEVLIGRSPDGEWRIVYRLTDAVTLIPCPGCGGSGISSCCDGAIGCAADVPGNEMNGK